MRLVDLSSSNSTNPAPMAMKMVIALLLSLSFTLAYGQPVMRSLTLPLEGTSIIRMNVGGNGSGSADFFCNRCQNQTIRLDITPATVLEVNGEPAPLVTYSPSDQDFVTAIYNPDTDVLTKLKVVR